MEDGSSPSSDQSPSSGSSQSPPSNSSTSSSPPPPSDSSSSSSLPPPSDSSSSSSEESSPPPPSQESSSQSSSSEGGNNNANNNDGGNNKSSPSNPSSSNGNDGGEGNRSSPTIPQDQQVPLTPPGLTLNPQSPSNINNEHSSNGSKHSSIGLVVGVVLAGGILLLFLVVYIVFIRKKKKKGSGGSPPYNWDTGTSKPPQGQYWQTNHQDHTVNMPPSSGYGYPPMGSSGDSEQQSRINGTSLAPSPSLTLGFNKSTFTYDELATATSGFDKTYMLGQGGFGYVHKGVLPNGKDIAVKSLKSGSGQGDREFHAEVDIISRVHHRHLVSLVGYCIAGGQRMLVYEFVPNDTLEYHLHKKGELDFSTRLRIALGGARGLAYLHEDCNPRIIHRDIKASNILLDENFEAKVADFGLAKLTTDTNTHVSTRVMGTFGYLAPEYASSGKLTEKSDVFSFGVMLLEIITGRRPIDPNMNYMEDSLVDWSRPLLTKSLETGNYHEFADPRLEGNYDPHLMKRLVACGAAAIRHSAKRRPKMSQIVRALEGDVSLDDLNDGLKCGQGGMSEVSSDYDTQAYSDDLKKFRQIAFETKDFVSSDYGGTTSDYGINPSSSSSDNSREMDSRILH